MPVKMKDLSLHILDIVQNSIRANALTVTVSLIVDKDNYLHLSVIDNGTGMDKYQLERVKDPFFSTRTTRKIGLGVPLLAQKAEASGGFISVKSKEGKGTELLASFLLTHPDCPPLGDIPECAWMLMASSPGIRMIFKFKGAMNECEWDSDQIRTELGGIPLTEKEVMTGILEWFKLDFSNFKGNI